MPELLHTSFESSGDKKVKLDFALLLAKALNLNMSFSEDVEALTVHRICYASLDHVSGNEANEE